MPGSSDVLIRIPKKDWADNGRDMRSRLRTWEWKFRPHRGATGVTLDFRDVEFMEPWALGLFACYALKTSQDYRIPATAILDDINPSNQYIRSMGIEHVLATGTSTPKWDDSRKNTGLHVIRTHADVERFLRSASLLGGAPAEDTLDAIKYAMAELGRNVVQHATSPIGGVAMAQYFEQSGQVQVMLCDTGRGILASLKQNYPEITNDMEAARLAVLPHVSGALPQGTYAGLENAGLGLFFCKEIACRSGGSFWLASGKALIGFADRDDEDVERIYRGIEQWPGTVVVVHLPANGIHTFEGVLRVCRDLADRARTKPGHQAVDFMSKDADVPDIEVFTVKGIAENVELAKQLKERALLPKVNNGEMLIIDWEGVRFVTQSFVHALLSDVFKVRGSLTRLSFRNCNNSVEESIRMVAAYSTTFRQVG